MWRSLVSAPALGAGGRGFESRHPDPVVSQDIGMTPNPHQGWGFLILRPVPGGGPGEQAGGLVVTVGVEGELAEEFAGGGVDDADLQVADEHQDAGSGVGPADADVVEAAGVAEGELAVGINAVGADPVVAAGAGLAGGGLGPGVIGGGGGGPVRQGSVRPLVVVDPREDIQQGLQLGEVVGLGILGGEPFLQGLLEPLGLALGLGVIRLAVLLFTPRRRSSCSSPLRPPRPPPPAKRAV